jgi:ribosomal protein S18 acetylase RimI-like enzyme
MNYAIMTSEHAIGVFIDGFAHLQSFVGPVTHGERDGVRYLAFARGRRASRFTHEFFARDADAETVLALAGAIAAESPHMIDLLGPAQERHLPAYLAAGYSCWGSETIMASDLASLVPIETDAAIDPVPDAETAARIVTAQTSAGLRAHPMTRAHIDDPRSLHYWVESEGEVAAFARLALLGEDAYLADVVTLPAYRRRGFANALARQLLVDARERGAHRCVLAATEMAHGLYRSMGFADVTPLIGVNTP